MRTTPVWAVWMSQAAVTGSTPRSSDRAYFSPTCLGTCVVKAPNYRVEIDRNKGS